MNEAWKKKILNFFLMKINNIYFLVKNLLETNNFVTINLYILILQKLCEKKKSGPIGLKILSFKKWKIKK
jgi:hypothetical protein